MGPTTRAQRRSTQAQAQNADDDIKLTPGSGDVPDSSLPLKGEVEEQEPATTTTTTTTTTITTTITTATGPEKKIVFSDDNDAQVTTSEAALMPEDLPREAPVHEAKKEVKEQEQEDGDDSDDEAPEAVSTVKAATEMKLAAQASQKAAKEQAAAQKRKRQQRDEMFKQQAERKKADMATKAAEDGEEEDKEEAAAAAAAAAKKSLVKTHESSGTLGRRRADKLQIPHVLPAELLTDSSDESDGGEDGPDGAAKGSIRRKRRKVSVVENRLTRLDKGPGDERVGSTVYRVVKKVDEKLAPKSNKASKNSKDALFRRNRTAVKGKAGFIKRK